MQSIAIGNSELVSSRLIYGCMRVAGDHSPADRQKGKAAVRAALEAGYTHFDHADIYGDGECERVFAEVMSESPGLRDELVITSKCGIRLPGDPQQDSPKRYDFSREHIRSSVEDSLRRLGVEQLDLFLLHRPDFLFDPREVAGTFAELQESGKVRHFGVSNFRPSQLSMLKKLCAMPLLVNQVEINIDNIDAIVNGTLDQCQELDITPMAWCPLGGVAYPGWAQNLAEVQSERVIAELTLQAEKYESEPWIVVLAWLLRHPAGVMPIIGSTRPSRIQAARKSLDIDYSREDWYRLLEARNGQEVP